MLARDTVHILDGDTGRRARIARSILNIGYHAELYEGLSELASRPPNAGVIMAYDNGTGSVLPEVLRVGKQSGRWLPVSIYSCSIDPERIVEAMLAGALDYLAWPVSPEALRRSLDRMVQVNRTVLERKRKEASARALIKTLTPRECAVLAALIDGASTRDMASKFRISPRTVEIHRAHMMKKLGARTAADAARIGLFGGLGF